MVLNVPSKRCEIAEHQGTVLVFPIVLEHSRRQAWPAVVEGNELQRILSLWKVTHHNLPRQELLRAGRIGKALRVRPEGRHLGRSQGLPRHRLILEAQR